MDFKTPEEQELERLRVEVAALRAGATKYGGKLAAESVETFRVNLIKSLDEPDAEMLEAFQQAFKNQLHRRRYKPGLESAEFAGIRALLKVAMNRERQPTTEEKKWTAGEK